MPLDTTLLDLDRAPTILEMRAFFKNTTGWWIKSLSRNQEQLNIAGRSATFVVLRMPYSNRKLAREAIQCSRDIWIT